MLSTIALIPPVNIRIPSFFQMPWIPFLPVGSVVINTGLMMTLEGWTWLRLVVWVAAGELTNTASYLKDN